MDISTSIVRKNEETKDHILLFLHKQAAYNIKIIEFDRYINIRAKLPNQDHVTISCGHTVHVVETTITHNDVTIPFDPCAEESTLLHFFL